MASLIAFVLSASGALVAPEARAASERAIHPALLEELSFGPDTDPPAPAVSTGSVPEPNTALMLALGIAGLWRLGNRRRNS